MTRPTLLGRGGWPLNSAIGGDVGDPPASDPVPDCCDPATDADMPDRAAGEDASAVSLSGTSGSVTFVQGIADAEPTTALASITLAAPPTSGNVLVLVMHDRTNLPAEMNVPDGFQTLVSNNFTGVPAYSQLIAWKVSDGTETTITFDNINPTASGAPETAAVLEFNGPTGLTVDTSDVADVTNDATPDVPSITPTAANKLIIAASIKQPANPNPGPRTLTGYTLGADSGYAAFGNRHRMEVFYRIEEPASGSYSGTISDSGDGSDDSNIIHVALSLADSEWNVPAPNVTDEDDATYDTVTGTDLLRLDLGAPFRIVRTRIRIAANTAGARTFTIKGANAADFSDEVTLTTIAFTATGSYTAQDVTGSWWTTEEYQYFELSIDTSDTYRVHAWELYEETPSTVGEHVADTSDAHDASAISLLDIGAYYAATDVEGALAEVGNGVRLITSNGSNALLNPFLSILSGDGIAFAAASNALTISSTVTGGGVAAASSNALLRTTGGAGAVTTIASSGAATNLMVGGANTFDVTLTADCTISLTGAATSGSESNILILLRQDGVGSHTVTWPGSVTWGGGAAPTLQTAAGSVDMVVLTTIDGGTVWFGTAPDSTVDAHIADTTDAHDASAVSLLDTGGYYTSTDVEGALAELGAGGVASNEDTSLTEIPAVGATETIDCSEARMWDIVLTSYAELALTGAVDGEHHLVNVLIRQDLVGSHTVAWPSNVVWANGTIPTVSATSNSASLFTLRSHDGGTYWYAYQEATAFAFPSNMGGGGGGGGYWPLLSLSSGT